MIGGVWGEEYQRDEEGEKRERGVGGKLARHSSREMDGRPIDRVSVGVSRMGTSFSAQIYYCPPPLVASADRCWICRQPLVCYVFVLPHPPPLLQK